MIVQTKQPRHYRAGLYHVGAYLHRTTSILPLHNVELDMAAPNFAYRPLPPDQVDRSSIRLIRLFPRDATSSAEITGDERLRCSMFDTYIEHLPQYIALSYAWGNTDRSHFILVDDASLSITKNLYDALRHLRHDDQSTTLWIDQICINQDDDPEKTEQVRRMQRIYGNASSVISWLGVPGENSDIAMDWIEQYSSRARTLQIGSTPKLRLRNLFRQISSEQSAVISEDVQKFLQDLSTGLTSSSVEAMHTRNALVALFRRPIWNRIWIVQEIFHSKQLVFRCGQKAISEDDMNYAVRLMRNFRQIYRLQRPVMIYGTGVDYELASLNTQNPLNILKIRRSKQYLELMYVKRLLSSFEASDPRDMIFALLNLTKDATHLQIVPDYSKTTQQVYIETTTALLLNGYFDILSDCRLRKTTPDLPSWVPDLTNPTRRLSIQQRALDRAGNSSWSSLQPEFAVLGPRIASKVEIVAKAPPAITVDGIFLGHVTKVGSKWDANRPGRWFWDILGYYCAIHQDDSSNVFRHICRTAVADQEIRSGNAKPRLSNVLLRKASLVLQNANDAEAITPEIFQASGLAEYKHQLEDVAFDRRPFSTDHNIGIGPSGLNVGDKLFGIVGSQVPYAIRDISDGKKTIVGEVYLHGLMDGEAAGSDVLIDTIELH